MERQTHKSMKKLELILHVECYTMRKFITHSVDELAMYISTVIVKIKTLQELLYHRESSLQILGASSFQRALIILFFTS